LFPGKRNTSDTGLRPIKNSQAHNAMHGIISAPESSPADCAFREKRHQLYDKRLRELGDVRSERIEIAPFAVERFGTAFGLVPCPPEDDGEERWLDRSAWQLYGLTNTRCPLCFVAHSKSSVFGAQKRLCLDTPRCVQHSRRFRPPLGLSSMRHVIGASCHHIGYSAG
jgi:hypothetical protein